VPPGQQDPEDRAIRRVGDDDEGRRGIDVEDLDLQALAEQVYALLKQELRLERERQGGERIW
jgi:hypothetical protein